jgi:hypothetical protein
VSSRWQQAYVELIFDDGAQETDPNNRTDFEDSIKDSPVTPIPWPTWIRVGLTSGRRQVKKD